MNTLCSKNLRIMQLLFIFIQQKNTCRLPHLQNDTLVHTINKCSISNNISRIQTRNKSHNIGIDFTHKNRQVTA